MGWAVAITERLTPVSNHRKRVDSSGEEKVFILRANFFEGLLLEHVQLRSQWGPLSRRWVPHDTRDQIVDSVNLWTERTEISAQQLPG